MDGESAVTPAWRTTSRSPSTSAATRTTGGLVARPSGEGIGDPSSAAWTGQSRCCVLPGRTKPAARWNFAALVKSCRQVCQRGLCQWWRGGSGRPADGGDAFSSNHPFARTMSNAATKQSAFRIR